MEIKMKQFFINPLLPKPRREAEGSGIKHYLFDCTLFLTSGEVSVECESLEQAEEFCEFLYSQGILVKKLCELFA